jgi:hypothetical protein
MQQMHFKKHISKVEEKKMKSYYNSEDIKNYILLKNPELNENHNEIIYEFLDMFYEYWQNYKMNDLINVKDLILKLSFNFSLVFPYENILWVERFTKTTLEFILKNNGCEKPNNFNRN